MSGRSFAAGQKREKVSASSTAEALKAQTLEAVGELRSLEVERLNSLQLAMWKKAMDGDVPSAIAVVRVIMARCRLLGLEGPSMYRGEDPRPRTLVVNRTPTHRPAGAQEPAA